MTEKSGDENLALFDELNAINAGTFDETRREALITRQKMYALASADQKPDALDDYLDMQIGMCFDAISGSYRWREKEGIPGAEKGIALLLERVTDPRQRAAFLKKAFERARQVDDESKKHLTPYAAQLLATPGLDQHVGLLPHDEHVPSKKSFGAEVIGCLQREEKLAAVNAQAPIALQMALRSALLDAGFSNAVIVDVLKARQLVRGLEKPPIDADLVEEYDSGCSINDEYTERVWAWKKRRIDELETPVADIKEMLVAGLDFDAGIIDLVASCDLQGDEKSAGGLVLLADVQQDSQRVVKRRVEDLVLENLYDLSEKAAAGNFLANKSATDALKSALPKLSSPQVSAGFTQKTPVGVGRWQQVMQSVHDPAFNKTVGTFLFDLADNSVPVHEEKDITAQRRKSGSFTTQFWAFYAAADDKTRAHLKQHAADRMLDASMQNIAGDEMVKQSGKRRDLIENGRMVLESNTQDLSWLCVQVGNVFTSQPHKSAYQTVLKKAIRSPEPSVI